MPIDDLAKTTVLSKTPFESLQNLVRNAGAEWLGVQLGLSDNLNAELWFRNPATDHKLHVTFNTSWFSDKETHEKILAALQVDNPKPKTKDPSTATELRHIADELFLLSKQLHGLYEEKQ